MSYLDKLYQKGEQKINALKNKLSNPIDEFEHELKMLRAELQTGLKASARIKALLIQSEGDIEYNTQKAETLGQKASDTINAQDLNPKAAEKAALHMLVLKKNALAKAEVIKNSIPQLKEESEKLEEVVSHLKENIRKYENDLDDFKLKAKISTLSKEAKETEIYSSEKSETIDRLEKLKEQIERSQMDENLLDDSYTEIASDELADKSIFEELENLKKK